MLVIKTIKFDLPIDGIRVKNLEELREHFTVEILALYEDGRLLKWCHARKMLDEVRGLEAIPATLSRTELLKKLCDIFSIKTIKLDLPIDGVTVKNLEELRDHFTVEILALYKDGRLLKWCYARNMLDEVRGLEVIPATLSRTELLEKLCDIFSVNAHDELIAAWAERTGQDQYGRYADLVVKGITQRFRWIEAGMFLMGSPESEPERSSNETQHRVTFQQGFWLADTACTQALWVAVMGNNPACFTDDLQNPVEQVSWDDVQGFLQRLNQCVLRLNAGLPSEAQWEYACRAGTTTAFSFGNSISPHQANYNGNQTYEGGGSKGEYRQKTVPVKSFTPNPWGLYQMHGNVWEWCQDTWDSYDNTPTDGSAGSGGDAGRRVLRGGSWNNFPLRLRSASRNNNSPDYRNFNFGFRLVVLSPLAEC